VLFHQIGVTFHITVVVQRKYHFKLYSNFLVTFRSRR